MTKNRKKRRRSIVRLSGDLLVQNEVTWPRKCIVCGESCDNSYGFKTDPLGWGPFAPLLVSSRLFRIRVHTERKNCRKELARRWFWVMYMWSMVVVLLMAFFILDAYFTHLSATGMVLFVLVNVAGIAFSIWFSLFRRPNVWIEEVGSDQVLGTKNYKFTFANASYAQEFKELNSNLLVGSD